jgi:transcriptional regulator with XRE-family HTH domain
MKTKPNQALRELRKIIGRTQGEFAVMIGASKDAVASWELGRNKLSPQFARRIEFATGVKEESLLRGRGRLVTYIPFQGHHPFTAETFTRYRESYWGRSDEAAAQQHLKHCEDALSLLFMAAAKPGGGKLRYRLPAVVDSFIQWCEQTREDFKLDPQIQEQLAARKNKLTISQTYGAWRAKQKEDPQVCRMMKFVDNPQKSDKESLTLEIDTVPLWRPGHSMRAYLAKKGGAREVRAALANANKREL